MQSPAWGGATCLQLEKVLYLYSRGRLKLDTGTRVIVYGDVTLATPAPTQIHYYCESASGRASIKFSVCIYGRSESTRLKSRLATTQYLIRFMLASPVGDDPVPRRVYPISRAPIGDDPVPNQVYPSTVSDNPIPNRDFGSPFNSNPLR